MSREHPNVYFSPQACLDVLAITQDGGEAADDLMREIGVALTHPETEHEYVFFERKRVTTDTVRFEYDMQCTGRAVTIVRVTQRTARKGRITCQRSDGALEASALSA